MMKASKEDTGQRGLEAANAGRVLAAIWDRFREKCRDSVQKSPALRLLAHLVFWIAILPAAFFVDLYLPIVALGMLVVCCVAAAYGYPLDEKKTHEPFLTPAEAKCLSERIMQDDEGYR